MGGSDDGDPGTTSGRGSSPSAEARPLSQAALKGTIRKALRTGTGVANRLLTRTQVERDSGVWLADDEDLDGVSEPLAAIASRRGGIAGVAASNPDVADAIAVMVAVAGYVTKQLALRLQARAYHAAAVQQQQQTEPEQAVA